MRIRKNKKVRVIAVLSILTFLISVGYAAIQTSLNVTATALIKNRTFNVYYSNIQTTSGSVTPTTAPATSGTSTTQLSWSVSMDTPGQFYEFTVDVTNAGTTNAMIADVLNATLTTEQAQYLAYTITYEDYKPIEQYDKLAVNETDSIRIRLEVKPDAQPSDIPNNPQITLNLGNLYGIADSNAVARIKATKYTIVFNKNHSDATGTMPNQVIIEDRASNLTANGFTRTGYHFTNWTTAADGSGTSYTDEQSVTNIGNTTLYANWAINTYTIAFDANGGTGTTASKSMTYGVAANLTANGFTRSSYIFKGWNTKADGSGTSYTNSQSVNNLTTENGVTVTLYAQWEKQVTKYAVQIYGINQDVDSSGNTLGLTFGPATGANYNNAYVTHEYEEIAENPGNYNVKIVTHTVAANGSETTSFAYLTNSSGNNVTRSQAQVTARENINLHEMTWAQIKAVQDKTVFEDCMLCGDTKSVSLTLNSTIASGSVYNQYGDGAGMLYNTVKSTTDAYYRTWNPRQSQNAYVGTGVTLDSDEINYGSNARNAGGYSVSHIRATLIGKNEKTNEGYAGDVNLTNETCLYSCIESDLQAVITPKKIKYVTGTPTSNYSLNDDIADSIWLFSDREMYGTGQYSGNTTEGLGASGDGYNKFGNTESKYYISSYNVSVNTNRVAYTEAGSTFYWWLRSPRLNNTYRARSVYNSGSFGNSNANLDYGLAFGFCIQ